MEYVLLDENPLNLRKFAEKSYALCLYAVKLNGLALQFVPEYFQSDEICIEALRENPRAFKYCKCRSENVLRYAVRRYWKNIKRMTKAEQTPDICYYVISIENKALKYIIEPTYEMCFRVIHARGMLKYVPLHMRDRALCLFAVTTHPNNILDVPLYIANKGICYVAVLHFPYVIQYVPIQTYEICKYAVNASGWNIRHVEPRFLTIELQVMAVKRTESAFKYLINGNLNQILPPYPAEEVCVALMETNATYIRYFPPAMQTHAVCLAAVRNKPLSIKYMYHQAEDVCLIAISKTWHAIKHIKEESKTPRVTARALASHRLARRYVRLTQVLC